MRKTTTYFCTLLAIISFVINTPSFAQMVGDQIFLKGKWVQVGVAPNGSLGSTRLPPAGVYNCNSPTFNFYDPGLAAFTGASNQRLMMVYDAGLDGFTTGTPGFFGDYSMPGTPYEGWGVQVNGNHSEAQAQYYLGTTTGFAGAAGLTGNNTAYLNPTGQTIGVWQGTAAGGQLQITQRTTLDTNASWVKMRVVLRNTGTTTLTGVHYLRETDPDNDQLAPGGSFTTVNVINHQNDYYHRVMVTATATMYTTQTLSLSTKDCRAKCFIHSGWPMSTSVNLATLWSTGWSGFNFTGPVTSDVAIGLVYNLGNIAAGDSTELSYAYVFNGLLGIDSAIANPQLVVNGIPRDSTDTVTSCSFTGSTLACSITNGSTADWFGSTWTWAPSTYLATTTGITNTISVSSITTPITYTITGTTGVSGCAGRTFFLTVMPPGTTPPPTTTTPLSYCLGAATVPLTASGIGTIYWWTTPTGGTGTTVAPTPSSAAVGTTTWYVSQVVAGCPSPRIPVDVTIFALSTPITGSLFLCTGFTTTLANGTSGGVWSSGTTSVATVGSSTGIVTGVSPGTAMISYSVLGCVATAVVTVTTTPAAITGIMIACLGSTTTLANSVPGGSWSSSNVAIATVGSSTGIVTGASLGTAIITYNMGGGCFVTSIVTVNPLPSAITGSPSLCVGTTTPLASATPGGLWTSSTPGIASVGVATGIVSGVTAGTATISYRVAGCAVTMVVTVVTAATAIIGPTSVCVGSTITLSNATTGGTWTSGATGIATIGSSSGIVTGVASGTATITYFLSAGCTTTRVVTVVPTPAPISGTLSICIGATTTLSHATSGGTWSSACPTIITTTLGTGVVTGLSAGTCNVTYTLPSGCISVATVTVNAAPASITGTLAVCQGATSTLSSATPGGTWSSSTPATATVVVGTGLVTGIASGTTTITYRGATGCITTAVFTVNATPSAITGTTSICVGNTTLLSSTTPGGVWSTSAPAIATVSGGGLVTGLSSGTTTMGTATITYTSSGGCHTTTIVTVNAGPAAITGSLAICSGFTTTLTSATTGGVWTSSAPAIATVLSPGFIGGSSFGTATISYTIGSCSSTAVVTVNTLPGAIGGSLSVCAGQCNTLTNATGGGTWASSNPAVATIDVATGLFCGVTAGTATITYSLGSGCITTSVVTVNNIPATIGGSLNICAGVTTTLTNTTPGGTWFSDNTLVATIGVGTGIAAGIAPGGTATISYTLPTGCRSTVVMTVNPVPGLISGSTNVCSGSCTTLTNPTSGGTWSSSNMSIGTINATTGLFCGNLAGTTTVSYTMPSGCARSIVIAVNPLPTGISGTLQVCAGSTTNLTGTPTMGTWASSTTTVGTIDIGSGVLTGVSAGTTTITYTLATGCSRTAVASVNPLPAAITGTNTVCVGQTTALTSATAGGTWASSATGIATVNASGVVSGVSGGAGSATTTITYTLPTGCRTTTTVTVFALPGLVTGAAGNLCPGTSVTLSCLPAGGTWTSGATGIATIGVATGIATGIAPGTANITYTLGTGCTAIRVVTVNNIPDPITGSLTTCVGQTTALSTTSVGGTWSSGNPAIASINSSGVVSGISGGAGSATVVISYTMPTTCVVTNIVTVYALPGNITGTLQVCEGLTSALTTSTPGGTWASSNTAVATVDISTGVVTGVSATPAPATATITYSLGTGCYKTSTVSVSPLPAIVTGVMQVCIGGTTTLSNATSGGTWSSSATGVATVVAGTGVVTGTGAGTAAISYTLSTGCSRSGIVTVHPLPSVIIGPSEVCVNSTITLGSTPPGGIWSSPDATVSINPSTGDLFGNSAGTATVSYTIGIGCTRTKSITVNPQPATITGNLGVCIGFNTLLATTSTGGTWNSSMPAVATIDASGLVTSVTTGTTTVMYTLPVTGCTRSVIVTVNSLPAPITGSDGFCNLSSTTYSTLTPGVRWSTSDPAIIVIDSVTGVATGVTVDTADIIVRVAATGCSRTKSVFLILAPYPIAGPNDMCFGQTLTLTNPIGGGVWSSSNPVPIPINSSTGLVTGAGIANGVITYLLSTGCASTHTMTVNPIPVGIIGSLQVCEGLTTTLTNVTPGGTWGSSDITVATIDPMTGIATGISAGTATITYALGTGCNATVILTVNPLPNVIAGSPQVCEGSTSALSNTSSGGTWSSANSSVASIDIITGVMTGMSAMTPGVLGVGMTIITYTLPTSCIRTQDVTVNPLPTPIVGISNICIGDITGMTNATPGGGWISSDPTIASIDVSGIVTGNTAGSVVISYMLPTGCIATKPFSVSANPTPITGSLGVCAGFTTNLSSGPSGGVWSQDPASLIYGTIHPLTGVVSGIMAGVIPITYTLGSGCNTIENVTVITLPAAISGTPRVCVGDSTVMTNSVAGGIWSSSIATRASIDPVTGMVHGLSAGTAVITYSVGTGCFNVHTITVNPLPASITGPLQVCEGSTILLTTATTGGNWISDTTAHATVGYTSGIVTGIAAGVSNISYVVGATGCLRAVQVTVNQTPPAIMGNPHVCIGASNTFTNAMPGGLWSSSNPAIATIGATTGVVTSVTTGIITITYQLTATGCRATRIITVQPLPTAYNVIGGGNYCTGGSGVHIYLSGSQPGVSYVLYNGASATGYMSGTGFALDFGSLTTSGVYTVQATNVTSGCIRNMSGSATVIATPLVTPTVAITTSPYDSVCPGQSVTLIADTANAGNAPTYLWKVNGVSVSTAMSYSFVPANGDVATVSMNSNANCLSTPTVSASRVLTVLPNALPIAGVITSPNDTICQFNPVTFTAAPTYGGNSPSYTWLVNGVVAGTGTTYSYIPVNGDVVNLRMTSDYRCRLATTVTGSDVPMTVDSLRLPIVDVYPDPGFEIEHGKPVTLHASVTNGGSAPKYQWKVNKTPIPGATQSSYTGIFNDYDSVTCTVISSGVCANIGTHDWVFISIVTLGANGSQISAVNDLRLIPNPNKGIFTIKGTLGNTNLESVNAEVTNMLGQVVYNGVLKAGQGKIDAQIQLNNDLANGMYILTLRTEQQQKVFHFVLEQ
jgi:uncharacterized protein YjdB